MDKCLPMGCSLSCALNECFSKALEEVILSKYAFHCVSHILDDFIFKGPADSIREQQLEFFLQVAHFTGIPIKSSKTIRSTCVAPINGIEVDTVNFIACLPAEKLSNLVLLLESFKGERSVRLHMWQSLIGLMNFATKIIRPGSPFIRKFINCIGGVFEPNHYIKLNSDICKDINIWLVILQSFNGVSLLSPFEDQTLDYLQFQSDASG